jgi:radical SAM/Cys-rich protein
VATAFPPLVRGALTTLQVNLGYRCNQACSHCHVDAGPARREQMDTETVALIPRVLAARGLQCLDLTGGAPELHPQFRELVREARRLGVTVIDRCNLTILAEPGQEDLAAFLSREGVTVVASLPCYEAANVDRQRGPDVFARSIEGLRQLNRHGYGGPDRGLILNLVFNPQGASLPPPQANLEADYRRVLSTQYGVIFNQLFTLTNMPIQRFAAALQASGELESYQDLLRAQFEPSHLNAVMCRQLISVDWQGRLFDCDFNQQLGQQSWPTYGAAYSHLRDLLEGDPEGLGIATGDHCFGCTAGAGSSCGGALTNRVVSKSMQHGTSR